ncbi:glycosyltransferase [Luteolibacter sp. GHJ8]|uniref:Glycosyltransferase n=1 Tax=Luteolibacter rhizosphaerae TaxID=2989719 RepID=A0ABT3G4K4_9BACT|nr:glycosyltransferase family 2 protein [Luteolibacter rhizosphaerae]MCW1914796.1 glycosyltransferase [Luteolibacter rhizosphaerae]
MIIIIPTCQRGELLERTLQCLVDADRPDTLKRVFVVENGKKEGAEAKVDKFRDRLPMEYRYTPTGSKCAALNLVLDELSGEFVVFYDDDVRIHPGALRAYANAAAGKTGGEFYAGKCLVDYDSPPPDWLKHYLPYSAKGWSYGEEICEITKPLALGFNWAAFSDDLKRAGNFDINIGPGRVISVGDETELQLIMFSQGVKGIYLPEGTVWHHVPADRCSPDWTLERNRRMGKVVGFKLASAPVSQRLPKAAVALGKVVGFGLLTRLGKAFLSETKHFHYQQRRYWNMGVWEGQQVSASGT